MTVTNRVSAAVALAVVVVGLVAASVSAQERPPYDPAIEPIAGQIFDELLSPY